MKNCRPDVGNGVRFVVFGATSESCGEDNDNDNDSGEDKGEEEGESVSSADASSGSSPSSAFPRRFLRYVALGDSQSEGLHDYDKRGEPRGYADRFAEAVAVQNPDLCYANLAVRGKRTAEIRRTQLEAALALRPDLATVVSGVNDVIRPGIDLEPVMADIEAMYAGLSGVGCFVMSCTLPIPVTGLTARAGPRIRVLNARVREIAERHNVLLVELESVAMAADLRLWDVDRIHLNPEGHARLGAAFAGCLAGEPDAVWQEPLAPGPTPGVAARAASEVAWFTRFVIPKIGRMVRGRSSGDGRTAKRPEMTKVEPAGSR